MSTASNVLVSGSERVGKSVATAMEAVAWMGFSELIWIGGHKYRDALKEFALTANALVSLGLIESGSFNMSEKMPSVLTIGPDWFPCGVPGKHTHRIETRTFYDIYSSIITEAPDLICLVEAGQITEDPLEKIRLRLTTRRGRLFGSGTLERSAPWFSDALERWQKPNDEMGFSISVPLSENTHDFPGGRKNPEIQMLEKTLRPSVFLERVLGEPGASEDLVFERTFLRGTLPFCAQRSPFAQMDSIGSRVPVTLCVDPGTRPSHYAVLPMQEHDGAWYAFDEIALQDRSHEAMIREAMTRPWWANAVRVIIDPWVQNQRGIGAGSAHAAADVWARETGLEIIRPEPAPRPSDVLNRFWYYLFDPATNDCNFFFDPDMCPHLLREWRHWRHPKDQAGRINRQELSKKWCDCIKAIGYGLCWDFQTKMFQKTWPDAGPKVTSWRLV